MDDAPESLHLTDLGTALRGHVRLRADPVHGGRLFWSALSAIVLMFLSSYIATDPLWVTAGFVGGFLLLVVTAASLVRMVQLPVELELDATALVIGDDRLLLAEIARIDATDGPPSWIVVQRDGTRRVFAVSEHHHPVADLAWFADRVRERLP